MADEHYSKGNKEIDMHSILGEDQSRDATTSRYVRLYTLRLSHFTKGVKGRGKREYNEPGQGCMLQH